MTVLLFIVKCYNFNQLTNQKRRKNQIKNYKSETYKQNKENDSCVTF